MALVDVIIGYAKGAQGDVGPQGPIGPQGPEGPQGPLPPLVNNALATEAGVAALDSVMGKTLQDQITTTNSNLTAHGSVTVLGGSAATSEINFVLSNDKLSNYRYLVLYFSNEDYTSYYAPITIPLALITVFNRYMYTGFNFGSINIQGAVRYKSDTSFNLYTSSTSYRINLLGVK